MSVTPRTRRKFTRWKCAGLATLAAVAACGAPRAETSAFSRTGWTKAEDDGRRGWVEISTGVFHPGDTVPSTCGTQEPQLLGRHQIDPAQGHAALSSERWFVVASHDEVAHHFAISVTGEFNSDHGRPIASRILHMLSDVLNAPRPSREAHQARARAHAHWPVESLAEFFGAHVGWNVYDPHALLERLGPALMALWNEGISDDQLHDALWLGAQGAALALATTRVRSGEWIPTSYHQWVILLAQITLSFALDRLDHRRGEGAPVRRFSQRIQEHLYPFLATPALSLDTGTMDPNWTDLVPHGVDAVAAPVVLDRTPHESEEVAVHIPYSVITNAGNRTAVLLVNTYPEPLRVSWTPGLNIVVPAFSAVPWVLDEGVHQLNVRTPAVATTAWVSEATLTVRPDEADPRSNAWPATPEGVAQSNKPCEPAKRDQTDPPARLRTQRGKRELVADLAAFAIRVLTLQHQSDWQQAARSIFGEVADAYVLAPSDAEKNSLNSLFSAVEKRAKDHLMPDEMMSARLHRLVAVLRNSLGSARWSPLHEYWFSTEVTSADGVAIAPQMLFDGGDKGITAVPTAYRTGRFPTIVAAVNFSAHGVQLGVELDWRGWNVAPDFFHYTDHFILAEPRPPGELPDFFGGRVIAFPAVQPELTRHLVLATGDKKGASWFAHPEGARLRLPLYGERDNVLQLPNADSGG